MNPPAARLTKQLQKAKQVTLKAKSNPPLDPPEPRSAMSAKDIIKSNKTSLLNILSDDERLILNKVQENKLITDRDYRNLKSISKEDVEGRITELLDKIMGKGDERCQSFLNLLETDAEIKETYPKLKFLKLSPTCKTVVPVQETDTMDNTDVGGPGCKKIKMDESYSVNSNPRGICLILNNINFEDGRERCGTDKDAESLAEVFSWLNFRVLMVEDQTATEMSQVLSCFSTLRDISDLKKLKEWESKEFVDLKQPPPEHGDVFICCILSHGKEGAVLGTDNKALPIQDITRTFKASDNSPLTEKPKIFLIQACQGRHYQRGVIVKDLEYDACATISVPEEADVLIAVATVQGCVSIRHEEKGSWFIQSVCQQLKEGCPRGDDIHSILQRVNSEVSKKEGGSQPGKVKQMPEIRYTLRKNLTLSHSNNQSVK